MRKFLVLLGTTVLSSAIVAGTASAAEAGRFYARGEVNYNFAGKATTKDGVSITAKGKTESHTTETKDKNNSKGIGFGAGIGYNVTDQIRTEAMFQYATLKPKVDKDSDSKKQPKIKSFGLLLNAYYDINNTGSFIPYVMGGIGYGRTKLDIPTEVLDAKYRETTWKFSEVLKPKSTNNFLWNVGAGAAVELQKGMYLDIGYRFGNVGKIKFEDVSNLDNGKTGDDKMTLNAKDVSIKNLNKHTIFAGLRVTF
ncbi:exported hypothetical protein [Alphaproteobacteria bacterium]